MRRFRQFASSAALVVVASVALGGCTSHEPGVGDDSPSTAPPVSARAVLDWDTSTIHFPLDAYGMNDEEVGTVLAAQQILIARCATGRDVVSEATLKAAREALGFRSPTKWRYGFWNSSFIAAHGWVPQGNFPPLDGGLGNNSKLWSCANEDSVLAIDPVTPSMITSNLTTVVQLMAYAAEANAKTVVDPRKVSLIDELNGCLTSQGYQIYTDGEIGGGVSFDDSWTSEQELQAAVAEAQCNDELNLTQQVGDIEATYQQQYIDAHQAELVAIRQIVDDRLSKARAILKEVGVL